MKTNVFSPRDIPNAKKVLAIMAHPDDPEFCAGGLIRAFVEKGAEAAYLILTDGSKGNRDAGVPAKKIIETRRVEQRAAARILGVKQVFFLDYEDGWLEPSFEARKQVVKRIRQFKPDVVITFDPETFITPRGTINHNDHRACGRIALDAVYPAAKNSRYYPELLEEKLLPHQVKSVFLCNTNNPNFSLDVSSKINLKLKALEAHESQTQDRMSAVVKRVTRDAVGKRRGGKKIVVERFRFISLA